MLGPRRAILLPNRCIMVENSLGETSTSNENNIILSYLRVVQVMRVNWMRNPQSQILWWSYENLDLRKTRYPISGYLIRYKYSKIKRSANGWNVYAFHSPRSSKRAGGRYFEVLGKVLESFWKKNIFVEKKYILDQIPLLVIAYKTLLMQDE